MKNGLYDSSISSVISDKSHSMKSLVYEYVENHRLNIDAEREQVATCACEKVQNIIFPSVAFKYTSMKRAQGIPCSFILQI